MLWDDRFDAVAEFLESDVLAEAVEVEEPRSERLVEVERSEPLPDPLFADADVLCVLELDDVALAEALLPASEAPGRSDLPPPRELPADA